MTLNDDEIRKAEYDRWIGQVMAGIHPVTGEPSRPEKRDIASSIYGDVDDD